MFARLGSLAARYRWFVIGAWLAVAVALTLIAPNIDDVAVSDQRAFLPASAPSLDASQVVSDFFPDRVSPSNAVLVIDAGQGNSVERGAAGTFVADLTAWLESDEAPAVIREVLSPSTADVMTKASLMSEDARVGLILVHFDKIGTEPDTEAAVISISERLAGSPEGVEAHLTGDGPIIGAYAGDTQDSVDSTTWITILLVVVILLVIYRSPVSPFIPLITIALAYLISRGVVALLAAHVLTISMFTNVFLIVVLFGAGTDYCLFLISRFREEMATQPQPAMAARSTVRAVGETIASSAGTVIVGLAMMTFAELGLFNTSGPSIAIGVAIALLAGLTLTPAMLSILGERSFWPRKARPPSETGFWHRWATMVVRHPALVALVPILILIPLSIYGGGLARDFDMLADLPKKNEARVGFESLSEHLGPGTMQPLNVVILDPARYDTPQGLATVEQLASGLSAHTDIVEVRSFGSSLGDPRTLSVASQLEGQAALVRQATDQLRAQASAPPDTGVAGDDGSVALLDGLQEAATGFVDIFGYLVQLAQSYPTATDEPGYIEAQKGLSALATLAQDSGLMAGGAAGAAPPPSAGTSVEIDRLVTEALAASDSIAAGLESLGASFASDPDAILLPELYLKSNEGLKALRDAYISTDGTAARLQVILDAGPYTPEAMTTVEDIRDTLEAQGLEGVVEGNSAVLLDLRDASDRDMTRTIIFVLCGVFAVLLLLLRALVAPIYLILTILLSYSATLGVVRLVFVDILGAPGITWWVPMFMFVMLVALGMDYNIFLMGRVKEEVALKGTRAGTGRALARTGAIITSAGIIMAGTFASMMSGSILGLVQIGFAVAFGILLDAFVIRTTLVPAIVVMLGRWSWWPRSGLRTPPSAPSEALETPCEHGHEGGPEDSLYPPQDHDG